MVISRYDLHLVRWNQIRTVDKTKLAKKLGKKSDATSD
jgi:mRNA-degrading endonuclease toxin of MazEF toxin-antitoxin module